MSTRLSEEQLQAIHQQGGWPLEVEDPRTQEKYVIVPLAEWRKQLAISYDDSGEVDPREVSLLVDQVMAEDDANDPALESYQKITDDSRTS